jgi:hypothetical protein
MNAQMSNMKSFRKVVDHFAFVQVKAFGDLTIAAASLRALPPPAIARCSLLIGPHLTNLVTALAPGGAIETLSLREQGIPPIFDLRNHGLMAGVRSAMLLRDALRNAASDSVLVMPRSAYRERFIAGMRPSTTLPPADNVYIAYRHFFQDNLHCEVSLQTESVLVPPSIRGRVALCPLSRVATKNMSVPLINGIAEFCARAGFRPELLLLDGECLNRCLVDLPIRVVPRRFDALADALTDYSGVISVDSLPSHLAEFRGVPSFVVTPTPNTYWLPLRAYSGQHWGLFGSIPELTDRLGRFLKEIPH